MGLAVAGGARRTPGELARPMVARPEGRLHLPMAARTLDRCQARPVLQARILMAIDTGEARMHRARECRFGDEDRDLPPLGIGTGEIAISVAREAIAVHRRPGARAAATRELVATT